MTLEQFFKEQEEVAIAFSGGVDSSYLLAMASRHAKRVKAYLMLSPFQPEFEIQEAIAFAEEWKVPLHIERKDILKQEEVAKNPSNRCYLCKTAIFSCLWERARADGFEVLCDGTNASDDYDDRPGMKALQELGVRSPLRECGLTKTEIRKQSVHMGLPTATKPSYSCLATRVPTGTYITHDILKTIEHAEGKLFALGYENFRVRYRGETALLQVQEADMESILAQKEIILGRLSPYFKEVHLDLIPRSGKGE